MLTESFVPRKIADKLLHKLRSSKAAKYIKPGSIICDLGCGREGNFLKEIEKTISRGFGFDFFVDNSFGSDKIKLQDLDLNNNIPLPDFSVDVVTAMAVLEHLNNYEAFIGEIYRILKKNGILILSTPSQLADPVIKTLGFLGLIDKKQAYDHKKYFNKKQLLRILKEAGFAGVTVSRFQFGFNQLVIGRK